MENFVEMISSVCEYNGEFEVDSELKFKLYPVVGKLADFPVLLFVGSDKITGDALAPICGTLVKNSGAPCFCYGDLSSPVTAKNIEATVEFIKRVHAGCKIMVVDASVGTASEVGKVRFLEGGIFPGNAVGRNFGEIGDFAIVGVVTTREESGKIAPTRLFSVLAMASEIAGEIEGCAKLKSRHAI